MLKLGKPTKLRERERERFMATINISPPHTTHGIYDWLARQDLVVSRPCRGSEADLGFISMKCKSPSQAESHV